MGRGCRTDADQPTDPVTARAQRIEPRQVRQQQPRIEPPPHRDHLAAIEHLFPHPAERALGQHRLGMIARLAQRREPPGPKRRIAPPRQIQPRARHPHPRRRYPHIAMLRQRIEKPHLAPGRQHRIVAESPRFFRGGGWGRCRVAGLKKACLHSIIPATTPRPPPLKRSGSQHLPRPVSLKLHVLSPALSPSHRNPPALLDTAIGIVRRHGAVPLVEGKPAMLQILGCRKIGENILVWLTQSDRMNDQSADRELDFEKTFLFYKCMKSKIRVGVAGVNVTE